MALRLGADLDINADNAGETPDERVFLLPDSDVGILVYNADIELDLADNTYLSMVDHVFSPERFEYQGKTANSSFDALLLLDSSGDDDIIGAGDEAFDAGLIGYWQDNDADGAYDIGEVTQLSGDDAISLNSSEISGDVIDGSAVTALTKVSFCGRLLLQSAELI